MAIADASSLAGVISKEIITPELLGQWADTARLITVLGQGRWEEIRGICSTASEFRRKEKIEHLEQAEFVRRLAEGGISNADEIAGELARTFPDRTDGTIVPGP